MFFDSYCQENMIFHLCFSNTCESDYIPTFILQCYFPSLKFYQFCPPLYVLVFIIKVLLLLNSFYYKSTRALPFLKNHSSFMTDSNFDLFWAKFSYIVAQKKKKENQLTTGLLIIDYCAKFHPKTRSVAVAFQKLS